MYDRNQCILCVSMPDSQIILSEPQRIKTSLFTHIRGLTPRMESSAKLLALLTFACYVLGLVIVNLYLGQFGITDFQVVKPECVFVGAWCFLLICASALPCTLTLQYALKRRKRFGVKIALRSLVRFIAGWFLVFGSVYLLLQFLPSHFGDEPQRFFLFQPSGLLHLVVTTTVCELIAAALVFADIGRFGGMKALRRNVIPVLMVVLSCVVLNIGTVAYHIYPRIEAQVGGGYPIPVVALFNKDGADTLALIDSLTTDPLGHHFAVSKDYPNQFDGELVYRGPDVYVIRAGFCAPHGNRWFIDQRSFLIDKRLISLVTPMPETDLKPFPCGDFPLPSDAKKPGGASAH